MIRLVCALALVGAACSLKVKKDFAPEVLDIHPDEEGGESDVSKETAGIFAQYDKDRDLKLDVNEYRDYRKTEGHEIEGISEADFRELQAWADPDRETGPLYLSMNDYQMLVNADKLIGSKVVQSQEALKAERRDWLNARQWRHRDFDEKLKDAIAENGDKMVQEIFTAYDGDNDGWLQIKEFNALQEATEGKEGRYDLDQFRQLLDSADPEREQEGLSFNVLKGFYLDPSDSEEFQTELPGDYEKLARNGHIEATSVAKELAEQFKPVAAVAEQPKEETKEAKEEVEEKTEEKPNF